MGDEKQQGNPMPQSKCDHRGIFTIPGALPIQSAWRDITYQPVRGDVWTASEGIYRTIFLEGKSGTIAFDTFSTPGGAHAYHGAIQRAFPQKRIHTIIYSHDHLDHTGYAADLQPDAKVISHELCARVVEARKADGQVVPHETWSDERQEFRIDGVRFELIYPGPTHGDGNIAAYFPQHRLLFMVDTVIPGVGYTFFPDWHIRPYVQTMRRFLSLKWDVFIPGHFWLLDRKGYQANLSYYERIGETAQLAIRDGIDEEDLAQVTRYARQKLARQFGHLFRFDEYIGMNLMRYICHYRSGGWGTEGNLKAPKGPL